MVVGDCVRAFPCLSLWPKSRIKEGLDGRRGSVVVSDRLWEEYERCLPPVEELSWDAGSSQRSLFLDQPHEIRSGRVAGFSKSAGFVRICPYRFSHECFAFGGFMSYGVSCLALL